MSSSRGSAATPTSRSRPSRPAEPEGQSVVQQLLAERRELMVANERLRLEAEELRRRAGGQDPRLARMEAEVARLRALLEETRTARDGLEAGIRQALESLRQK